MKKIIIGILAAMTVFGLAGCSSSNGATVEYGDGILNTYANAGFFYLIKTTNNKYLGYRCQEEASNYECYQTDNYNDSNTCGLVPKYSDMTYEVFYDHPLYKDSSNPVKYSPFNENGFNTPDGTCTFFKATEIVDGTPTYNDSCSLIYSSEKNLCSLPEGTADSSGSSQNVKYIKATGTVWRKIPHNQMEPYTYFGYIEIGNKKYFLTDTNID